MRHWRVIIIALFYLIYHNLNKWLIKNISHRITASNAIIFANTDNSFQAILKLLDDNELSSQQYINEFPILTAMARNQDASLSLIQKFKAYIQAKKADFPYLRKTILIYSSLVKSYCKRNECNQALLVSFDFIIWYFFLIIQKYNKINV